MMDWYHILHQRLAELNLFDTETDDEHLRRNEILSTRFYIIIFIVILSLFTLYTSLLSQTTIVTITTPTQKQYDKLAIKYSNSLQCPCKQVSTPYEQFISIVPKYHEICSSDFVSQKWIDYLFYDNTSYYFQLDFRRSASSKFQILRILCEQAQKTIDDSLEQFYSTQFITNQLVSITIFNIQADSFIQLFKQTTPPLFQNLLKLIRETITASAFYSAIEMHSVFEFEEANSLELSIVNIDFYEASLEGKLFDCYCGDYTICQLPEGIYTNMNVYDFAGSDWFDDMNINASTAGINATFLIPGMNAGCMSSESIMSSTTECLYEQTCLDQIAPYIPNSSVSLRSFSVLNQSQSTRERTIETLANELFVEEWITNKSYEKYFDYCQPLFCQYTDEFRYSFIYILAAIISLYGGLRGVLRFSIPIVVTFIRKKKQQQQMTADIIAPTCKCKPCLV